MAGTAGSGLVGVRRLVRLNPRLRDMLRTMSTKGKLKAQLNPQALMHGHMSGSAHRGLPGVLHRLAPAAVAALGGVGAYNLAKREPQTPVQKLRETFKLGAAKTALSINRDDGIGCVVDRLREGLKQARARRAGSKVATKVMAKVAALTALGAGYGAVREKDPGESRAGAIGRSAATGMAGDVGGLVGAGLGAAVPGAVAAGASALGKRYRGHSPALRRTLMALRRGGRGLGLVGALGGGAVGALLGTGLVARPTRPIQRYQTPPGSAASY